MPADLQRAGIFRRRGEPRGQGHARGTVRAHQGARRDRHPDPTAIGPCLFEAQGRRRSRDRARCGDLALDRAAAFDQARDRHGGDRDRPDHDLCRQVVLPAHHRSGRDRRPGRAAQADRGSPQEARRRRPVRRGAQETVAAAARRDRRRDLADRCRDPRHQAPARRPVSAHASDLAGGGAGRGGRRADRRRDRRVQSVETGRGGAAPRPADRRARRRLARGSDGLQRGSGRARGGGERDPADLGRRARDRLDPDRSCRRPARADADARRPRWRCRCAPS